MAVPSFLSGTIRYLSTAAVTDVATIITDMQSELVTNGSWTEPVGSTYKSPVDAYGRYVNLIVSRVSATRIQFKGVDHNGLTMYDGTFDIDAAGCEVRYFTSARHCFVESVRATTPECGMIFWIDPEPDVQNGSDIWPWAMFANRQSSGSATTALGVDQMFTMGSTIGTYANLQCIPVGTLGSDNVTHFAGATKSGAYMFAPAEIFHYFAASGTQAPMRVGRIPHVLVCASAIAAGTELTIPIDTGTTGVFKRFTAKSAQFSTHFLVRKS